MNARLSLILPIALLAACDRSEKSAQVSVDAGSGDKATGSSEGTSFRIDTEGFKADIQIPGLAGLSDQMKIDGVRLYPESRVSGLNVTEAAARDQVSMRFDAPADIQKVREWYVRQFAENSFSAEATGTGFQGTTGDGDRFRLDLTATPDGHTFGEFRLATQR